MKSFIVTLISATALGQDMWDKPTFNPSINCSMDQCCDASDPVKTTCWKNMEPGRYFNCKLEEWGPGEF